MNAGDRQTESLRAYRGHRQVPFLEAAPGDADLTADVDFAFLRCALEPVNILSARSTRRQLHVADGRTRFWPRLSGGLPEGVGLRYEIGAGARHQCRQQRSRALRCVPDRSCRRHGLAL